MDAQVRDLSAAGCTKLFSETVSSVAYREQLDAALDFVRDGDTLVVTRLDRLARSTADLLRIIDALEAKGVGLRVCDFGGSAVDTQSPTGRLMVTMFGALAEFERTLMLARQREGIERAKTQGRYKGRAPTARAKGPKVLELHALGVPPAEIASRTGISRASAYRIIAEASA
jgi:DNA invertase Pin-like site-specific DNA recombinase